jgi:hypothetical protein
MYFVYIVLGISLIILLLVYLIFIKPVKVSFIFDTDRTDMHMNVRWLFPFLDIKVIMQDYKPLATVYIFKKKFFTKKINKQIQNNEKNDQLLQYYNCLSLKNSYINTFYSLYDPFVTSIVNIVLYIAESLTNTIRVVQNPNFIADHAYIALEAGTNLNVGKSVTRIISNRFKKNKI